MRSLVNRIVGSALVVPKKVSYRIPTNLRSHYRPGDIAANLPTRFLCKWHIHSALGNEGPHSVPPVFYFHG
jgi:hypothetical protein